MDIEDKLARALGFLKVLTAVKKLDVVVYNNYITIRDKINNAHKNSIGKYELGTATAKQKYKNRDYTRLFGDVERYIQYNLHRPTRNYKVNLTHMRSILDYIKVIVVEKDISPYKFKTLSECFNHPKINKSDVLSNGVGTALFNNLLTYANRPNRYGVERSLDR
jgi:hypothetical protein